eukprot:TRINITY_DN14032_c0_g1_i2.p1 TRINITY_DN14032_c0_g1~~TRINITY_DN14032_c0_g1_i2.p1  ORF type:complete len:822 (+),score=129.66 TRINITY_DN14032_c0_g1_i2:356-2467(+)
MLALLQADMAAAMRAPPGHSRLGQFAAAHKLSEFNGQSNSGMKLAGLYALGSTQLGLLSSALVRGDGKQLKALKEQLPMLAMQMGTMFVGLFCPMCAVAMSFFSSFIGGFLGGGGANKALIKAIMKMVDLKIENALLKLAINNARDDLEAIKDGMELQAMIAEHDASAGFSYLLVLSHDMDKAKRKIFGDCFDNNAQRFDQTLGWNVADSNGACAKWIRTAGISLPAFFVGAHISVLDMMQLHLSPDANDEADQACSTTWIEKQNVYGMPLNGNLFAGGETSTELTLEQAQAKCAQLGPNTCRSVTCTSQFKCRVGPSEQTAASTSGETVLLPKLDCDPGIQPIEMEHLDINYGVDGGLQAFSNIQSADECKAFLGTVRAGGVVRYAAWGNGLFCHTYIGYDARATRQHGDKPVRAAWALPEKTTGTALVLQAKIAEITQTYSQHLHLFWNFYRAYRSGVESEDDPFQTGHRRRNRCNDESQRRRRRQNECAMSTARWNIYNHGGEHRRRRADDIAASCDTFTDSCCTYCLRDNQFVGSGEQTEDRDKFCLSEVDRRRRRHVPNGCDVLKSDSHDAQLRNNILSYQEELMVDVDRIAAAAFSSVGRWQFLEKREPDSPAPLLWQSNVYYKGSMSLESCMEECSKLLGHCRYVHFCMEDQHMGDGKARRCYLSQHAPNAEGAGWPRASSYCNLAVNVKKLTWSL